MAVRMRWIEPAPAFAALILGIAGILGFLPGTSVAEDCAGLGTGTARYRLLQAGREVGTEGFSLVPGRDTEEQLVTADARGTISGSAYGLTQALRVDARSHGLRDYTLEALLGGQKQTIRASRAGDSVVVIVEGAAGRIRRAFAVRDEVFILDNLLMNHISLLGCRIAADGFRAETLRVVVPQVGSIVAAAVLPGTPAADGSRTVELRIGGVAELLQFDVRGRLAAVEVPTQSLRYERVPDPTEAAAPVKPARPEYEAVRDEPAMPSRVLFQERTIQFMSHKTAIDGVLTLPRGGQPIPYRAVLLVPGAGPLDRDETIGPNQPFLELARALAVNGIASLRFDKRTLSAPKSVDPATMTVQEELIDDAVAAIEFLRSQTEINAERIVVVGHDLGGDLAASIARADRRVAGMVILAGSLRPLDEQIRDNLIFMRDAGRQDGGLSADDERTYAHVLTQIDSLEAGTLPDRSEVMGMTGRYLRDVRSRDRAGDFLAFRGPVLILRGEKDTRMVPADLALWRATAERGGKRNVEIREFPSLGHLFIPIAGKPGPMSLYAPGHVDPAVSEAIVAFVAGIR
jgi:uncharacterized protein